MKIEIDKKSQILLILLLFTGIAGAVSDFGNNINIPGNIDAFFGNFTRIQGNGSGIGALNASNITIGTLSRPVNITITNPLDLIVEAYYAGVKILAIVDGYGCEKSYCIYLPWYAPGQIYAKNGSTGEVEFNGNFSAIITSINSTANGNNIVVNVKAGNYTLTTPIYNTTYIKLIGESRDTVTINFNNIDAFSPIAEDRIYVEGITLKGTNTVKGTGMLVNLTYVTNVSMYFINTKIDTINVPIRYSNMNEDTLEHYYVGDIYFDGNIFYDNARSTDDIYTLGLSSSMSIVHIQGTKPEIRKLYFHNNRFEKISATQRPQLKALTIMGDSQPNELGEVGQNTSTAISGGEISNNFIQEVTRDCIYVKDSNHILISYNICLKAGRVGYSLIASTNNIIIGNYVSNVPNESYRVQLNNGTLWANNIGYNVSVNSFAVEFSNTSNSLFTGNIITKADNLQGIVNFEYSANVNNKVINNIWRTINNATVNETVIYSSGADSHTNIVSNEWNTKLILDRITTGLDSINPGEMYRGYSPIIHLKLNDDAANTDVDDSVDVQATGTSLRNTNLMTDTGRINKAFNFSTLGDKVTIPYNVVQNDVTNGKTISVWVKPRSQGQDGAGTIMHKGQINGYYLYIRANNRISWRVGSGVIIDSALNAAPNNVWTHIFLSIEPNGIGTIYTNNKLSGIPKFSDALSEITNTSGLVIGNNHTGARTWDGLIDDYREYNYVLTPGEREMIYNNGVGTENEVTILRTSGNRDFGNSVTPPNAFGAGDTYFNSTRNYPCWRNATSWNRYNDSVGGC